MHKNYHTSSKIVVKIGSESIGGSPDDSRIKLENLARDIAELKASTYWRVYVVTSGAVLHGKIARGIRPETKTSDQENQMLAAIGQGYLMKRWNDALSQHGLFGAQIMTTHGLLGNYDENKSIGQEVDDDLVSSVRNGFLTSLEYIAADPLVVPIINENDPVTPEEIKEMKHGADNDQNALLIARLTRADYLAIITNTDGVWKNPAEPKSRIDILHASNLSDEVIERMTQNGRSNSGTGGMGSKLRVMRDATHFGVGGYIYDGITSSLAEFIASKEFGTPLKGGTVIR